MRNYSKAKVLIAIYSVAYLNIAVPSSAIASSTGNYSCAAYVVQDIPLLGKNLGTHFKQLRLFTDSAWTAHPDWSNLAQKKFATDTVCDGS